jgi:DNA-binding response OmpR family regulator
VIVVSSLLAPDAEEQEHEAATFYVPKPFNTAMLMEKINELLNNRNP